MTEWRDVIGYEEFYKVNTLGDVKTKGRITLKSNGVTQITSEKLMKPQKIGNYVGVYLYKGDERSTKLIHRLVAQAFIPNPENKEEVNHIDGNPLNNKVSNLEWVTSSENTQHALLNKLINYRKVYSDEQIIKCYEEFKEGVLNMRQCCIKHGISYKNFHSIIKGNHRKYLFKNFK